MVGGGEAGGATSRATVLINIKRPKLIIRSVARQRRETDGRGCLQQARRGGG